MIPSFAVTPSNRLSTARLVSALAAVALVAGCAKYPSPGPATPLLTKAEATALSKCQQATGKAQLSFAKTKGKALLKCTSGILKAKVPFENDLLSPEAYDAAIEKMRLKCTKSYDKITAASTRLVDAILEACGPADSLVTGSYDGLKMQVLAETADPTLQEIAGGVCTLTELTVDMQSWVNTPRSLELLDSLGEDWVYYFDDQEMQGVPNVTLDSRCPPIETADAVLGALR